MESLKGSNSVGSEEVLHSVDPYRYTSQIPTNTNLRNDKTSTGITKSVNTNYNLTSMIKRSIAKNLDSNTPPGIIRKTTRQSFRSSQARSSLLPQQNLTAPNSHHNTARDPRPLRDKNFLVLLQQEIFSYLIEQKFDVETNHPISLKALKQPTQKDFIFIFKWLYLRLDPGYIFTKSLEHEVYSILRTIHYPYLATINKSQISAVGGSNWPKFVGILHWLVVINKKLDECLAKLDMSIQNQVTQDMTVLNQPLKTSEEQDMKQEKYELMVERLFIDYITESYKSFLRLEDDYDPYLKDLELSFQKFVHIIETDIAQLNSLNESMSIKCESLVAKNYELKSVKQKNAELEKEYEKLNANVSSSQSKSCEWPVKLRELEEEISKKREEIKHVNLQIDMLKRDLVKKNLEVPDIEGKNRESDLLSKNVETVSSRVDQLTSIVRQQKVETESVYKNLVNTSKQCQSAIEGLILARQSLGDNINQYDVLVALPPELMSEEKIGLSMEQITGSSKPFYKDIKSNLCEINNKIKKRIKSLQSENGEHQSKLEELRLEIKSKTEELEQIETDLSSAKTEFDEFSQESQSKLLSQNIEIEKLERKIQNAKNNSQQKIASIELKVEESKLDLEELHLDLARKRNELHNKVIEVIEFVSNFKINMQISVEELSSLSAQEVKKLVDGFL